MRIGIRNREQEDVIMVLDLKSLLVQCRHDQTTHPLGA